MSNSEKKDIGYVKEVRHTASDKTLEDEDVALNLKLRMFRKIEIGDAVSFLYSEIIRCTIDFCPDAVVFSKRLAVAITLLVHPVEETTQALEQADHRIAPFADRTWRFSLAKLTYEFDVVDLRIFLIHLKLVTYEPLEIFKDSRVKSVQDLLILTVTLIALECMSQDDTVLESRCQP